MLDIFYFETDKDITFYSKHNDNKITLHKNNYTYKMFEKIKNKFNFIALV